MRKTGHLKLKYTAEPGNTCKICLIKQKKDLGHMIARSAHTVRSSWHDTVALHRQPRLLELEHSR